MEQMSSETVVALNNLEWKPTGCGMVADCFAADIAGLERAIFNVGVSCSILDFPGGCSVFLYRKDFARLARQGMRFPGRFELDLPGAAIAGNLPRA